MKNLNESVLMQDLNKKEMREVNGGVLPILIAAAIIAGTYAAYRYFRR